MSRDCMLPPLGYRVASRTVETHDTATLTLQPVSDSVERCFAPGQFMMLYAHGVGGEVAVSVSVIRRRKVRRSSTRSAAWVP